LGHDGHLFAGSLSVLVTSFLVATKHKKKERKKDYDNQDETNIGLKKV
jgi:hypothetical protein